MFVISFFLEQASKNGTSTALKSSAGSQTRMSNEEAATVTADAMLPIEPD